MQIFDLACSFLRLLSRVCVLTLAPQIALLGSAGATPPSVTSSAFIAAPLASAQEVFRQGMRAYYAGHLSEAVVALERAALQGHPLAAWKLGQIYVKGEGELSRDAFKAFRYFNQVALSYARVSPRSPQATFGADAVLRLAEFYKEGIPEGSIPKDPERARRLLTYAASYFGYAEAQFSLGRFYLAEGSARNPYMAVRWLNLAAQKGHRRAQLLLGELLFEGVEVVPLSTAAHNKDSGPQAVPQTPSDGTQALVENTKQKITERRPLHAPVQGLTWLAIARLSEFPRLQGKEGVGNTSGKESASPMQSFSSPEVPSFGGDEDTNADAVKLGFRSSSQTAPSMAEARHEARQWVLETQEKFFVRVSEETRREAFSRAQKWLERNQKRF